MNLLVTYDTYRAGYLARAQVCCSGCQRPGGCWRRVGRAGRIRASQRSI